MPAIASPIRASTCSNQTHRLSTSKREGQASNNVPEAEEVDEVLLWLLLFDLLPVFELVVLELPEAALLELMMQSDV